MLNALIETGRITLLSGALEPVAVPTGSGRPHDIHRCRACRTALWSDYGRRPAAPLRPRRHARRAREAAAGRAHLHAIEAAVDRAAKDIPAFEAYTDTKAVWPAASLGCRRAILG